MFLNRIQGITLKIIFTLITLIISSMTGFSQEKILSIKGVVVDENLVPVEGVLITLNPLGQKSVSDSDGKFAFKNLAANEYTLILMSIDFETLTTKVNLEGKNVTGLNLSLQYKSIELEETKIVVKSLSEEIEETGFEVESLEVEEIKSEQLDVNQLLKTKSGINIREGGGMGSNFSFSLNGLSGNRVRFFIDDIPIDYLGEAYRLNNLPINLVDRIDIYKGVVPVRLGADALGGAVNILTKSNYGSFVDASYSYGSFNSHRFALNAQYRNDSTGLTIRPKAFYNSSNNNYIMRDMEIYIDKKWETKDVRRFHDNYNSVSGMIEAGYTYVKWADELLLGAAVSEVNKEQQQDFYGNPLGEVYSQETNKTFSLRYNKSELLNNKLELKFFTVYNQVDYLGVDTSSNRYNWLGEIMRTVNDNTAEVINKKTAFEYKQKTFLYRAFSKYDLSKKHSLEFSYLGYHISRQGENRVNIDDKEPFRSPNKLNKNVSGLAYTVDLLKSKLKTTLAVKHYGFQIETKNAKTLQDYSIVIEDVKTQQSQIGYLIATRYFFKPNFFLKTSFEKGYRLPEPIEILGDGLSVYANPELQPESTNNFNLGAQFKPSIKKQKMKIAFNYFVRDVRNYIYRQAFVRGSRHKNIYKVLVHGFELSIDNKLNERLDIGINLTNQNVLNNEKYVSGTNKKNRVYGDQLPNTPKLFGNINMNCKIIKSEKKHNASIYYRLNFVKEFFLGYESIAQGSVKNTIPTQVIQSLGATIISRKDKLSLSLECSNIFNSLAFDNFNFQKPGRAFSVKIRCYLNKF